MSGQRAPAPIILKPNNPTSNPIQPVNVGPKPVNQLNPTNPTKPIVVVTPVSSQPGLVQNPQPVPRPGPIIQPVPQPVPQPGHIVNPVSQQGNLQELNKQLIAEKNKLIEENKQLKSEKIHLIKEIEELKKENQKLKEENERLKSRDNGDDDGIIVPVTITMNDLKKNFKEKIVALLKDQYETFRNLKHKETFFVINPTKLSMNDFIKNTEGEYHSIFIELENDTVIALCGKIKPQMNPKADSFIEDDEFFIASMAFNGEIKEASLIHHDNISYDPTLETGSKEILTTWACSILKSGKFEFADTFFEDIHEDVDVNGDIDMLHPLQKKKRLYSIQKLLIVTWK